MAPLENAIVLNIMSSLGIQLIGSVFSVALWGISCMQVFMYFLSYDNDHWALKLFVVYLWLLDTVVEALTFVGIFPVLITKWGSIVELGAVSPDIIHRTWLSFILAFSVQMFLLYRIYKFTGGQSWIVRVCLVGAATLAVWQIVGIIIYTKWVLSDVESIAIALAHPRVVAVSIANRAASALTDILIATWMTILLTTQGQSVFQSTNRLVLRLIFITINTGMWTAIVASVDFSLIAWRSTNLAFTLCELPLSALYLNMCLANLNARHFLRDGFTEPSCSELEFDTRSRSDTNVMNGFRSGASGSIPLKNMARGAASVREDDLVPIRIDTSATMKTDKDSAKMLKGDLVSSAY